GPAGSGDRSFPLDQTGIAGEQERLRVRIPLLTGQGSAQQTLEVVTLPTVGAGLLHSVERLAEQWFGFRVPVLQEPEFTQRSHCVSGPRMLGAQDSAPDLQDLQVELLGRSILGSMAV